MSDFARKISTPDRDAKSSDSAANSRALRSVAETVSSPGAQLDATTRRAMEKRFGHDLAGVRVHIDARAAKSAEALDASAYTAGRNIVFGGGNFSPNTRAGRALLAHELTHAVHQKSARPSSALTTAGTDALEKEASSNARHDGPVQIRGALSSLAIQRQDASAPKDEEKPGAKTAVSQPPPKLVPVAEVHKQATADPAAGKKKESDDGPQLTATQSTETEITHDKSGFTAKPEDKFELELTIPITDRLHLGRLTFLKEASVSGSLGFPSAQPYPKSLSSLEAETSLKVLSLEYEKVKVPLGTADFGISASVLANASYDFAERKSELKTGFSAEAEAKFHPGEKSPFFITATVGVEEAYDKEGNANFKFGPATWKGAAKSALGVGVDF